MNAADLWPRVLARVVHKDGCWLWTGACSSKGYGHINAGGRTLQVHRLAVIVRDGSIPAGLTADHRCHDARFCKGGRTCPHRRCVNPAHLEVVTRLENQLRAVRERRAKNPGRVVRQTPAARLPAARPA